MLIRQASRNDARRISYLIQKNTEKVVENNYSSEQIEVWKKANTQRAIEQKMEERILFVAFDKGKLVGTIGLQGNEVLGLYVSHTQRGKGIGRQLLKHLEAFACAHQIESLILTATPSGFPFYERNGFEAQEAVIVKIDGVDFMETKMIKKQISPNNSLR